MGGGHIINKGPSWCFPGKSSSWEFTDRDVEQKGNPGSVLEKQWQGSELPFRGQDGGLSS